jgi:dihydrofolate reductase
VLSHKERKPIEMEGGTTFFFVTDGIEAAIRRAKEEAGNRNVKIMGGANTVKSVFGGGTH